MFQYISDYQNYSRIETHEPAGKIVYSSLYTTKRCHVFKFVLDCFYRDNFSKCIIIPIEYKSTVNKTDNGYFKIQVAQNYRHSVIYSIEGNVDSSINIPAMRRTIRKTTQYNTELNNLEITYVHAALSPVDIDTSIRLVFVDGKQYYLCTMA